MKVSESQGCQAPMTVPILIYFHYTVYC